MKHLATYILTLVALLGSSCFALAGSWQTHYSYSKVEQIAVTPTEVYGLSSGSIFSVNKISEHLTLHDLSTGLHSTGACTIGYDPATQTVLVAYRNGKMDLLDAGRITYVGDLYLKETTLPKSANSVAFRDGIAYLAMPFGILCFDMKRREFSETCFVGSEAKEENIRTIFFSNDKIYAATDSLLFSATLGESLVDYRDWTEQLLPTSGPLFVMLQIARNPVYADDNVTSWAAAGADGICKTGIETIYYKPDGPADNNPYRMYFRGGKLYVVPGGRWATQDNRQGQVSFLQNGRWNIISNSYIRSQVGAEALDFMNVAAWPDDPDRFVVTSYGTGVYEFRNTTFQTRYMPDNSCIGSAAPGATEWASYVRTDGAVFDSQGNLWLLCAGGPVKNICIRDPQGAWHGLDVMVGGEQVSVHTPGELIISNTSERYKWIPYCRYETSIILLDDHGTPYDGSDDNAVQRKSWIDQDGVPFAPEFIYCAQQDRNGGLWVGTGEGAFYIAGVDAFLGGNACERLHIYQADGTDMMQEEQITCLAVDAQNRTWIGTKTQGVYVLSPDRRQVLFHFTAGDTPMQSNSILSLAIDDEAERYYIGTGMGIVSYSEHGTSLDPEGMTSMDTFDDSYYSGTMGGWSLHFAYQQVSAIAVSPTKAYGLSEGALFYVDREDESIHYLHRLTGLSDANISSIHYDFSTRQLLILYGNGNIDMLTDDGTVYNVADFFIKQISGSSKEAHAVCFHDGYAYMAMSFGIMKLNMRKHEIADTYYIGPDGSNIELLQVGISGDSIYAATPDSTLYAARLADNLVDYNVWTHRQQPQTGPIADALTPPSSHTIASGTDTFVAGGKDGIVKIDKDGYYTTYIPNGPAVNLPYAMTYGSGRIFVVPGGRWATQWNRYGNVMIIEDGVWKNIPFREIKEALDWRTPYDFVSVAVDPADKKHFSVMSYGTGVYEFRDDRLYMHRSYHNSPNGPSTAAAVEPERFTRCEGGVYDNQGNLWLLNAGSLPNNICIMNPQGQWTSFNFYHNGTQRIAYETPGQILIDSRKPNYKWLPSCRNTAGLGLLDDGGTPFNTSDDRMVFRSTFIDQNGNHLSPEAIYCISQDRNGTIWIGTNEGIITIPGNYDFFTTNQCQRLLINRTDGSGLADWLLNDESIKAIVHDGGNRHWIATAASGVFLISYTDADVNSTIHHFTTANSPLPSNNVLSIAIHEQTGEVFFGTENGLASFRSDANQPQDDYSDAYVFPNPVRPEYRGNITFSGLMENTYVKVLNSGGEVVFSARSNGGMVVWDGRDTRGNRVTPGVYKAYCNTADKQHTIINLLVM